MKSWLLIILGLILLSALVILKKNIQFNQDNQNHQLIQNQEGGFMKILSPAFNNNSNIPSKYTCDGENINPPLEFTDIPVNTQSLTLIMDDPDAPMGTWVHWIVMNINPNTKTIPENSVPTGTIQGTGSGNTQTYQGPCPPSGSHRYFFKLYALDTKLNLPTSVTAKEVELAIKNHILAKAELLGLYKKQ